MVIDVRPGAGRTLSLSVLKTPAGDNDLLGGGLRLLQRAEGYLATVASGEFIQRDGQPTGKLPGKLARSSQMAPT